jgi:hypothetical protein
MQGRALRLGAGLLVLGFGVYGLLNAADAGRQALAGRGIARLNSRDRRYGAQPAPLPRQACDPARAAA